MSNSMLMNNPGCIGDVRETRQREAMIGIFNRGETWLLAEYDRMVGAYRVWNGMLFVDDDGDGIYKIATTIPVASDCGFWQRLYKDKNTEFLA